MKTNNKSETVVFNIRQGTPVRSLIDGFEGKVTQRGDCLNGCHRYFVEPPVDKKTKDVRQGYWIDENELEITGDSVLKPKGQDKGGPKNAIK